MFNIFVNHMFVFPEELVDTTDDKTRDTFGEQYDDTSLDV